MALLDTDTNPVIYKEIEKIGDKAKEILAKKGSNLTRFWQEQQPKPKNGKKTEKKNDHECKDCPVLVLTTGDGK